MEVKESIARKRFEEVLDIEGGVNQIWEKNIK